MKRLLTIGILLVFISPGAYAQDKNQEMTKEEKRWMQYMTPGEIHKMVASWDGEWSEEILMWRDPELPPTKYKADCTNKMLFDGRYQVSDHTGEFDGMPFEGRSTLAYDNGLGKFLSTWIDNMGTGIMYMEGEWDADTRTITFYGKVFDPMEGKMIDAKETFQVIDDNTQLMKMFKVEDDEDVKTMEIVFRRK